MKKKILLTLKILAVICETTSKLAAFIASMIADVLKA